MKNFIKFGITISVLCYATLTIAQEPTASGGNGLALDQRLIDQLTAPIKSRADLRGYLAAVPADSPLRRLTPGARKRFIDSLVFSPSGLASYSYEDIASELTAV
ncbi:hypothetical protein [Xanthomonas theicola]|uniref:Uncharacterized protein n=1 Tax=Xanthomonas theicola TaxID=56464 RepID=A0A2S6ZCM5_9XANT|nr:hypothetical protein [Xanthomonas theicola]PPT88399.1 hypothetical protein XthCFBP4691_14735 [Xanthomonas theicola]QNH25941.1 hypothetical protein G4Q83_15890 [Xanthomonas theicola]